MASQVVNLDLPYDGATYAHRVGRGGRYGTRGVAVTFVSSEELGRLHDMVHQVDGGRVRWSPPVALPTLFLSEVCATRVKDTLHWNQLWTRQYPLKQGSFFGMSFNLFVPERYR